MRQAMKLAALDEGESEPLFTITVKVPVTVARVLMTVAKASDLKLSPACSIGLERLAQLFEAHWRPGLALSSFLQSVGFDGDQLNLLFERVSKRN